MICALCRQDREIKNSHIIPEWVYKDLYDDRHRFHILSSAETRHTQYGQKGIREKLLCGDCEQLLSTYEKYAREVIKGGESIVIQKFQNGIIVTDINYKAFKLFQISILWRAGVAKSQLFSKVTLGPHEEKLRTMLFSENPGDPWQYGCLMFGILDRGEIVSDLIDQPEPLRLDGMRCFRFVFSGFVWVFFVASHSPSEHAKKFLLTSDGVLKITLSQFQDLEYLKCLAEDLERFFPKKYP